MAIEALPTTLRLPEIFGSSERASKVARGMGDRIVPHYILYPKKSWEKDDNSKNLRREPSLRLQLPDRCVEKIQDIVPEIPTLYPEIAGSVLRQFSQTDRAGGVFVAMQDLEDILKDELTIQQSSLAQSTIQNTISHLRAEAECIKMWGRVH